MSATLSAAALLDSGINDAVYAEVVGHGEVWSARLMSAVLNQQGLPAADDAREFLRAERAAQPQVDEGLSYPLLQQLLVQHPGKRLVVTGFISRNNAGETVLLGRNGSDYSATQIGALAGVSRVTIWSDVAGVYSADPRKVKDACLLPLLRLDEASELARLAAPFFTPVLYSQFLAAKSTCSCAVATRRIKAPRALNACWPPVLVRVLSPATMMSV